MSASVITIVRDRSDHLRRLVDGLRRCDPPADDLVIVDMGSTPPIGNEETCDRNGRLGGAADRPAIRITRVDGVGSLPLAAARNLGADLASSERLIFLDVDCIPAPDLVGAYLAAAPDVVACAPVRYLRDGWSEELADCIDVSALWAVSEAHELRPAPLVDTVDDRYELFWSLSFAVDRELWDLLGGFDEEYVGYGGEDTDLALTARRLGVPLLWLASGTAFHQWHPSADPPTMHLADIVANARRFHTKWLRWPMQGWLAAFADQRLIRWQPEASTIEIVRTSGSPDDAPTSVVVTSG